MKFIFLCLLVVFYPQQTEEIVARFQRAVEFQRAGELEKAAMEYRALLKAAPTYAEAQANYGVVLSRLGKYEEAVRAYETALDLNSKLFPIRLNLGIAHYRAGNFVKAAQTLDLFLTASPGHAQANQLLGVSLVEIGRYADSVRCLKFAIESEPDNPLPLYYAGIAYLQLNNPEFDAVISRLESNAQGKPLALVLRGQRLLEGFDFSGAASALEDAARMNAELPRLQGMLGLAYFKLGRGQEAIACFESELKRSPNDFLTLYYLAQSLEKQGEHSEAHRRIHAALREEPQSAEALALLSQILFKLNQPASALEAIDKALAIDRQADDDSIERRYLRARILQRLGRKVEAAREIAAIQKAKNQAQGKPEKEF
jgi:tetratricopeptide (TPR) repeat protein